MTETAFNERVLSGCGERNLLKTALMNLTVLPALVLWTILVILISPLAYLAVRIPMRWSTERTIRALIWIYGRVWLFIAAPFVHFTREGFGQCRAKPPAILVLNHLSFFDVYFMGALPFSNVIFAIRSWPFKMFWYTPFMRMARYLDVEKMGWEETLEAGKDALCRGSFLLFFPESHRSRNGQLQRFHSGAFRLAVATGTPLVPLCITGTDELLPPGSLWMRPARVRLRALSAVDPRPFSGPSGHMEMRKMVKAVMAENIAQMRHEDGTTRGRSSCLR